MHFSLSDRLLSRETAEPYRATPEDVYRNRSAGPRGLYGDKRWVRDLNIVNELGGHSGCVNALSWSTSGRLLASGSDDTHLNIHTYQPDTSSAPFSLSTTIATGHTQNIFSVKFMPHSNDSVLVSCAGDHQVRVFDIEHASNSTGINDLASNSASHTGINLEQLYRGVRFLGPTSANGKVFRSHTDRVKRIVTESSPYLFLTCSEDGEVRQWDLRLPSSAYPPPRRRAGVSQTKVPPPLISYKNFRVELNSISCSKSQPHYLALGGGHLHAFLHDRRMLGRDRTEEAGSSSPGSASPLQDEMINKATRCVRRFAPNGQQSMERNSTNHLTALKISDARPNEMIASWSGDHIYTFDLISSPDAHEPGDHDMRKPGVNEKKRKRQHGRNEQPSQGGSEDVRRGNSRSGTSQDGDVALRVRYGNGQSEEIPIAPSPGTLHEARETVLSTKQRQAMQVSRECSKLRKSVFSLEPSAVSDATPPHFSHHQTSFSDALSRASGLLSQMTDIDLTWPYPMLPDESTALLQKTMRRNRAAAKHFVQATGTIANLLGGTTDSLDSSGQETIDARFAAIDRATGSNLAPGGLYGSTYQKFCYLFLAAICSWLRGGHESLLTWFKPEGRYQGYFEVTADDGEDAIQNKIIHGLLTLANEQERAIINVDASRFEGDRTRIIFRRGADAVQAFGRAVEIPFSGASTGSNAGSSAPGAGASTKVRVQPRNTALQYWVFKIGRGLLLSAGEGVNYAFVNRAFGGLRVREQRPDSEGRNQEEVNVDEGEEHITDVSLLRETTREEPTGRIRDDESRTPLSASETPSEEPDLSPVEREDVMLSASDIHAVLHEQSLAMEIDSEDSENGDEDFTLDNDDDGLEAIGDSEDESGAEYGDSDTEDPDSQFIFSDAAQRSRLRNSLEATVPCSGHTRVYKGHCNVRTVKDVNYFGRYDEYVVSGSDCGHMFIWERTTGKLLNVLKADSDVVNVMTGHPYEPLLAVSGIDHTIKIFSPDQRAQTDARRGINLATAANPSHGSSRIRPRAVPRAAADADDTRSAQSEDFSVQSEDEEALERERPSNGGLQSCTMNRAEIDQLVQQNDLDRTGGAEETFITREMLQHLATQIRARGLRLAAHRTGDGAEGNAGEDAAELDEEVCRSM